jgi:hypothetical protein
MSNCDLKIRSRPEGKTPCERDFRGGSNAYSSLGGYGDGRILNGAGGGSDVRSCLSGLPARVHTGGHLLRMQLYLATSVQRVGVGPCRTVCHQSIFRERTNAHGTISPVALIGTYAARSVSFLKMRKSDVACPQCKAGYVLDAARLVWPGRGLRRGAAELC